MSLHPEEQRAKEDWYDENEDKLRYDFMVRDISPSFRDFLELKTDTASLAQAYAIAKAREFNSYVDDQWMAKGRPSGGSGDNETD